MTTNLSKGSDLPELLTQAIERMDRARDILTKGNPTPECNWGMLDTSDLRKAIAAQTAPNIAVGVDATDRGACVTVINRVGEVAHVIYSQFHAAATDESIDLTEMVKRHVAAPPTQAIAEVVTDERIKTDLLNWAVDKWYGEVSNRPVVNIHRRSLDDTWRQVIRKLGGDDVLLCGLRHDDLVAAPSQGAKQ